MKPQSLEEFPLISTDKLRYGDTDRQGHVNNAVFMTFLETGRVEVLHRPSSPIYDDNAEFVLVNVNLNLQGEIQL
jgi:acyl-CoA thioester hydrolase